MGFVGVGRGGHRGKPVGSGYLRTGSSPRGARAGSKAWSGKPAADLSFASNKSGAAGGGDRSGLARSLRGGWGFSFGSRSRLEGRERGVVANIPAGELRAPGAPAPGWARGARR
jgi:hypothetical protein